MTGDRAGPGPTAAVGPWLSACTSMATGSHKGTNMTVEATEGARSVVCMCIAEGDIPECTHRDELSHWGLSRLVS